MEQKRWLVIMIGLMIVTIMIVVLGIIGHEVLGWFVMPMYGHMGWMTPFGLLGMILFWGIIILIVFTLFSWNPDSRRQHASTLLKERLARGEISIEEFDDLMKKIKE